MKKNLTFIVPISHDFFVIASKAFWKNTSSKTFQIHLWVGSTPQVYETFLGSGIPFFAFDLPRVMRNAQDLLAALKNIYSKRLKLIVAKCGCWCKVRRYHVQDLYQKNINHSNKSGKLYTTYPLNSPTHVPNTSKIPRLEAPQGWQPNTQKTSQPTNAHGETTLWPNQLAYSHILDAETQHHGTSDLIYTLVVSAKNEDM